MNQQWIVRALLRIYPTTWRAEYAAELEDMLMVRPLSVAVICDVLKGALLERLRATDAATRTGLVAMLLIGAAIVPLPVLENSSKTFPTIVVKPFMTEWYVLVLVACGYLRYSDKPGRAAIKTTFIAGLPVMLAGVLMWMGVLDLSAREFTFAYDIAEGQTVSPLAVIGAPLSYLPQAWIWGCVGGKLGRRFSQNNVEAVS